MSFTMIIAFIVSLFVLVKTIKSKLPKVDNNLTNTSENVSISINDSQLTVKKIFNLIPTIIAYLIHLLFLLAVLGGILYVIYSILTSDAVTTIRTGSAWSKTEAYKEPEAKVDYLNTLSVKPSIEGTAFITIESNATYRFQVTGKLTVHASNKGVNWTTYIKPNGRLICSGAAYSMPKNSSKLEYNSFPFKNEYEGKAIIKINDNKLYAVSSEQEVEVSLKKGDVVSLSINFPSRTDETSVKIKDKWTVTTYRVTYKQ